jgi:hypothetical protein
MRLDNEFTIKDLYDNKMIVAKNYTQQTLYNWAQWGWLNGIDRGTERRAKYYFTKQQIEEFNSKLKNGFKFPTPKREIKQPKNV